MRIDHFLAPHVHHWFSNKLHSISDLLTQARSLYDLSGFPIYPDWIWENLLPKWWRPFHVSKVLGLYQSLPMFNVRFYWGPHYTFVQGFLFVLEMNNSGCGKRCHWTSLKSRPPPPKKKKNKLLWDLMGWDLIDPHFRDVSLLWLLGLIFMVMSRYKRYIFPFGSGLSCRSQSQRPTLATNHQL